jgi:glycosyltransferase involved in cell wall biosynthesis
MNKPEGMALRGNDVVPPGGGRVAVLVPCFNEEAAVAKVVADFRAALPQAAIHVYDNNSTDRTAEVARAAGALVRRETHQGKGNVVRRMFSDVDADIYVLVDGDATYDAPSARAMIAGLIDERLDMVVAARVQREEAAYRPGHRIGNRLLTGFVASVFRTTFTDVLSGYRVFSRRFVKSFPVLSRGFEIEIELTVHALELELAVAELATPYYARPEGSVEVEHLARRFPHPPQDRQPLSLGTAFGVLHRGWRGARFRLDRPRDPIFVTYLQVGIVPRIPTAVLSTGVMLAAFLSVVAGVVLDTVSKGRREMKLLAYLAQRAPGEDWNRRQP